MSREHNDLNESILLVVRELCGIREQLVQHNKNNAILHRLAEMEKRIMSAISDYTDAVDAKFTDIGASVDELVIAVTGVSTDVASLKELITKLKNNPGPLSPEDQALLTKSLATVTSLADRTKAVAEALKALDAATENPPPAPA